MAELGDEDNPVGLAWGRGIPGDVAKTIIPARYNNIDSLRRLFERQGERDRRDHRRAGPRQRPGILPKPGFHQAMRALTEEFGILLIFDEVKTGFRFAKGGAAEFFGITPDIATYAKAMGNGYPAAAFAGRDEVMSVLPDKVSHGGTYAGNRVAAAAAVKTLEIIRDTDALETIHATGERDPGRPRASSSTRRACRTTSPATRRCSASCSPRRSRPSTATGRTPTTSCTTRSRSGCTPGARCPSRTAASRGSSARPTPRATRWTGSCRSSATRSTRPSRPGRTASGGDATGAMSHPAPAERTGDAMTLDGNAVRSVDRAAALLLALGESHGEAGVTELARRLGLHKSTASRLLATLEKRGLVEQDEESGKYRLGLVVIRLANGPSARSTCARSRCPSWTGSPAPPARRPASACSTATSC